MKIRDEYLPFGKPCFSEEETDAVTEVLRSGWVGMGTETIAFETELAEYFQVPHVVTVNSCTSALFLSLLAHGVGPGDEVICPSLTWCSTANAALYLNAQPVFCDVDPHTLSVTVESVMDKVTDRTKAVVVVHFGGLAMDVQKLRAALGDQIAIVEDAAHALGATFEDHTCVGSSSNLTCFSFYANKNLSTGDGGAIALEDDQLADRLRSLRQHSLPIDAWKRFCNPKNLLLSDGLQELGYKMNYTDLQACLGRVQLRRQAEFAERRLVVAKLYKASLEQSEYDFCMQYKITSKAHARHLFVIRLPEAFHIERDQLILALRARNIGASIHYAPLHHMPLYGQASTLPVTDKLGSQILTLPISASMSKEDAEYVMFHFNDILKANTL